MSFRDDVTPDIIQFTSVDGGGSKRGEVMRKRNKKQL